MEIVKYEDKGIIETLKATVAQGLNDSEFKLFTEFCKSTGLNPFKKEIWAIKAGGRLQLMTGINGFQAIANANEEYDGMESGLITPDGSYATQAYPTNDFIGAWARVYRKDRKMPLEAVAMLGEYKKSTPIWQNMTRIMILKCAKSVALREAFPQQLNGLYTAEEMPSEYSEAPAARPISNIVVAEVSEKKASYAYEIWQLDEKKQTAAQRYLEENNAQFDEETSRWVSTKQLKRLEAYEVKENA